MSSDKLKDINSVFGNDNNVATQNNLNDKIIVVSTRLKELRKLLKISQEDLADAVGTTQTSISQYESLNNSGIVITKVLIYFFENHKINPLWLFLDDNSTVNIFLESTSKNSFDYKDVLISKTSKEVDGLITKLQKMKISLEKK